ncbi:MAG: hypothetical protein Kow0031_11110 [Anaerolineae bacterium]
MATEQNLAQAWLTKAEQTLAASNLLLSQHFFDDAASRAYYAMFAAAKAALISIDIETRSHTGLKYQFGQHFVRTGLVDAKFAKMLSATFEVRQSSDYGIFNRPLLAEAQTIVANAEQFVSTIKELLSESNESE